MKGRRGYQPHPVQPFLDELRGTDGGCPAVLALADREAPRISTPTISEELEQRAAFVDLLF
jgi:hypothetical protein